MIHGKVFLLSECGGCCCNCSKSGYIKVKSLSAQATEKAIYPEISFSKSIVNLPERISPGVVGLSEISENVGRMVVFEGYVWEVYKTSTTGSYYVRFEKRQPGQSILSGFKLAIIYKFVNAWATENITPKIYEERTIKARGIIRNHPEWGIEMLVTSPSMIEIID